MPRKFKYLRSEGTLILSFIRERQLECLNSLRTIDQQMAAPGPDLGKLPQLRKYYEHAAGFLKRCQQLVNATTDWSEDDPLTGPELTNDPTTKT